MSWNVVSRLVNISLDKKKRKHKSNRFLMLTFLIHARCTFFNGKIISIKYGATSELKKSVRYSYWVECSYCVLYLESSISLRWNSTSDGMKLLKLLRWKEIHPPAISGKWTLQIIILVLQRFEKLPNWFLNVRECGR